MNILIIRMEYVYGLIHVPTIWGYLMYKNERSFSTPYLVVANTELTWRNEQICVKCMTRVVDMC